VPADSNDSKYLPRSPERPPVDSHDSRFVGPPVTSSVANLHRHSMTSVNSGSTIKAPQRATADLTAEDHLTKGIDLHERGSLKESTYHLRIAARQNNPTAMLLYALACRHGWGMRQNPKEGVQWLRKAMDYASLELENDHNAASRGRQGDVSERKTRRAQFALSVYELGVSHMNGWGIEQDKALALRCFEIASDWGDADAMAEAGFCYAQGVGCKKDLKKAARYYRSAEAKGMSMVGNSWYVETRLFNMIFRSADDVCIRIYKPKYASDSEERSGRSKSTAPEKEKKPRDKSRTRTLFGRKRSNTQAAPST
jgi:TPR repeat protein